MALVSGFDHRPGETNKLHKPVVATWKSFQHEDVPILQIDTFGTDERMIPGKLSQSIQLDRAGADALRALIDRCFP